jgi:hypothetical protein
LFTKDKECFIINTKSIYIEKLHGIYSFYSSYYAELDEKLAHYSIAKILKSSCHYFSKSWFDEKHIYFKNKPEEEMQISLKEFLSSALRNIEVVREFTLGAHKPVDIRVRWLSANRSALIEVKWLGNSLNNAGDALGTEYKNSRATEGIKQLKKYLELSERDMPETIAKAYLVVFDGRRRNISKRFVNAISEEDGLYYKSKDLKIPEEYDYHRKIHNFAKPIRMFASPICL